MRDEVVIVPTGTANLASVDACIRRLGRDVRIAESPADIETASRVVLPGVGTFGAAGAELSRKGFDDALQRRLAERKPTLAVCVGMQLLASTSQESPGDRGLGSFDAELRSFEGDLRVPQMGWNRVAAEDGCRYVRDGWAYFANSYRLESPPAGWHSASTTYGSPFVSALESGGVLACQFHPELSGEWGSDLVNRWLEDADRC